MPLIKDAGLTKLHSILGCRLKQTKDIFDVSLERAFNLSEQAYLNRTKAIQAFSKAPPSTIEKVNDIFKGIEEIEKDLDVFLTPESEDLQELQEEALSQLSFQDPYFRCMNFMPYVLLGLSMFKIWIVPTMAIVMPFIAWVIPYLFLKFMYKLPISAGQYGEIMKMLWSGNPIQLSAIGKGAIKTSNTDLFSTRSILQGAFMVFSFAQSLIQPIENARHLYRIDQKVLENGKRALRLQGLYEGLKGECSKLNISFEYRNSLNVLDPDFRRAIHHLIEEPERFKITLQEIAEFEILWRIARSPLLHPVKMLTDQASPVIHAKNLVDISLGSKGIPSNFSFTVTSHHAVLTGPNGGGKSSFLRGILQCCLLSHSYGVAPAEDFVIQKISWISSGLCLQDNPGNLSMFESEVFFAANILKRKAEDGLGIILYDELFHSTNPPDGVRTAEIFLKELWMRPFIGSIVSTHVFELVEAAPNTVQRLCCSAEEKKNGLKFLYDVKPGVCRVSSVKSIWERFGLSAGKSRSEKHVKKENLTG